MILITHLLPLVCSSHVLTNHQGGARHEDCLGRWGLCWVLGGPIEGGEELEAVPGLLPAAPAEISAPGCRLRSTSPRAAL